MDGEFSSGFDFIRAKTRGEKEFCALVNSVPSPKSLSRHVMTVIMA
jgi:hypothetical protein